MTVDDELKDIQLKIAKVDLDLKKLDYERRHSLLTDILASPPILAVAITACITLGSALITWRQSVAEQERAKREEDTKRQEMFMMNIINSPTDCALARKINLLLSAGFLRDDAKGTFQDYVAKTMAANDCNVPQAH